MLIRYVYQRYSASGWHTATLIVPRRDSPQPIILNHRRERRVDRRAAAALVRYWHNTALDDANASLRRYLVHE